LNDNNVFHMIDIDPTKPDEINAYIEKIYEAFNRHCEDIHAKTVEKINATAEDDVEARKKILAGQKMELDKSLAELKRILSEITAKARKKMEEIENRKAEKDFNLEKELANV
jgi:hypothetical protein